MKKKHCFFVEIGCFCNTLALFEMYEIVIDVVFLVDADSTTKALKTAINSDEDNILRLVFSQLELFELFQSL